MKKLALLIAMTLAAFAASFAAGTAAAQTVACQPWQTSSAALPWNDFRGFHGYLAGLGSPTGAKALAAPAPTAGVVCGTPAFLAIATKTVADEKRFYALRKAFPAKPTKAQWKAKLGPLVAAGIAADDDFSALYRQDAADHQAWYSATLHCPAVGPCDNGDLPETVQNILDANGGTALLALVAKDRAALLAAARAPYGKTIR